MGYKERLQASIDELEEQLDDMDLIEAVIRTLPDKHTDIMLFNSVEEMNACTYAENGTVGVVYYSSQRNVEETDTFQQVTFPETVILPEAYTGYSSFEIRSVDQSVYLSGYCDFNSSRFSIDLWGDTGSYRIQYTSSDGVTYTRTTFEGPNGALTNPVDFGIELQFEIWDEWSDSIGFFMLVGGVALDGIYQYDGSSFNIYTAQLDSTTEDVLDVDFYGSNGVMHGTLQQVTDLNTEQIKLRRNIRNMYNNLSTTETNFNNLYMGNKDIKIANFSGVDTSSVTNMSNMFYNCQNLATVIDLNTSNVTDMYEMFWYCNNLTSVSNLDTSNVTNMYGTFLYCNNLPIVSDFAMNNVVDARFMFSSCKNLVSVPIFNLTNIKYVSNMFNYCNNLSAGSISNIANSLPNKENIQDEYPVFLPNIGINANRFSNSDRDVLLNKGYLDADYHTEGWSSKYNINGTLYDRGEDFDRYGLALRDIIYNNYKTTGAITVKSDGTDNGILLSLGNAFQRSYYRQINPTSIQISVNTSNIVSLASAFYDCANLTTVSNFDTSNVTTMYLMFSGCNKLTTIPNFNTNNVTNMTSMFASCNSLKNVVLNFNTSKVTGMYGMFIGCRNLLTISNFDTSNATTMANMFRWCYNLTTVPNFNTSNVTNMNSMFVDCNSKLTTVPNFDTSNVIDMESMFGWCYNLVSVPQFNTNNTERMSGMFALCNKLSDASIQNIINMCLNSNITNANYMNLMTNNSYSLFGSTNITNTRYQNRWAELDEAGWTY